MTTGRPPLRRAPRLLEDGTSRLVLRAHHDSDIPRLVEQSTDPLTLRWTTVPSPYGREDAARFVRDIMPGGWATEQEWGFAVEYDGRYAATVTLRSHGPGRAELAYAAHPDVRGTGVVERACRMLLDWGFAQRDVQSVVWWANRGNFASRRLAWRLGFLVDGRVRRWLDQRGSDGRLATELADGWEGYLLRGEPMHPAHPWLEPVTIRGDRVRLRRGTPEDAETMSQAATDPQIARMLSGPLPFTPERALEYLLTREEDMAAGRAVVWVIADQRDRLVGLLHLASVDERMGTAEVGYWVAPAARGHGVAGDALRLALRHAFVPRGDGGLGLHLLRATVADGNDASHAVLRRAGFAAVGHEDRLVADRRGPLPGVRYQRPKSSTQ